MLLFALTVIASSFAGAVVADRIHPGLSTTEKAGLGFLLAFGGLAWILQILHAMGVPPGAAAHFGVSMLAGAMAFGALVWRSYRSRDRRVRIISRVRRLFSTLPPARVSFLLTLAAVASAASMSSPVLLWDSLAIWAGKARGFIVADSLSGIVAGAHQHYPIGLPILMAGGLDFAGEPGLKLIGPLFATALAAIVLGLMERRGSAFAGMLTAAAIFLVPFALSYTFSAYADLPMGAVYVSSAIYLIEYIRSRDRGFLWLSALLLGATALVRLEAPLLFAVNFAVLLLFGRSSRIRDLILYLAVFALAWIPWQIISRVALGIDGGFSSLIFAPVDDVIRGQFDWPRVGAIIQYFLERAIRWTWWGLTFPVTAAGLIVLFLRDRRTAAVFTSLLAGNLLVQIAEYYSSVYLDVEISGDRLNYFLESGWDRMTLHWAPLGLYGAGVALIALLRRCDAAASIPSLRSV